MVGYFQASHNVANAGYHNCWLHAGGWAGIVTAAVVWYASASGAMSGVSGGVVFPGGKRSVGTRPEHGDGLGSRRPKEGKEAALGNRGE